MECTRFVSISFSVVQDDVALTEPCIQQYEARLFDDVMITFESGDINVWDITRFSDHMRVSEDLTEFITLDPFSNSAEEPLYRMLADEWSGQGLQLILSSNWYINPFALVFDAQDSASRRVMRYNLQIPRHLHEEGHLSLDCVAIYSYPDNYDFSPLIMHPPIALAVNPGISFGTLIYLSESKPDDEDSVLMEEWDPLVTRWAIYSLPPPLDTSVSPASPSCSQGSPPTDLLGSVPGNQTVQITRVPFVTDPYTVYILVGFCPWTGRVVFDGPRGFGAELTYCNIVDFLP